jgi:hypothetical protein
LHPLTGGESIPQAFGDGRQAACGMVWKILKNGLRRKIGRRRTVIQIP